MLLPIHFLSTSHYSIILILCDFGQSGGTETTIVTLRWAILYLAAHPEIQEKLAAELDSVVGRDRLPELTDREATPYMEATIHEVMRMGSLAPTADFHTTTVDTTLSK